MMGKFFPDPRYPMVRRVCKKCGRIFERKSGFDAHLSKKKDCGETTALSNSVPIVATPVKPDYTKQTVAELIVSCKTAGVKGYSGKSKAAMITLLEASISPQVNELVTSTRVVEPRPEGQIRYIDLFSGLGAFHTAFNTRPDTFKCVLACDIDEGARRIYKANYGLEPKSDIRDLDLEAMPDFEVLCAGFPCQPFSIAGNGEGFKDTVKGNLFYDILKIIDKKTPPMCILENVKNLKTHDKGNTYRTIEAELKARGYLVTSKVINASEYGSPQARHRIFIVATKEKAFVIPEGTGVVTPVRAILDPAITADELNRAKYTLQEKPEKDVKPGRPHILYDLFPIPSEKKRAALEAEKAEKKAKKTDKKEEEDNDGPKGGRQGERVYSVDAVGITVCASSGGPGAKTGLYKVGKAIRRLSVGETLKMFGFPETYTFPDTSDEDSLFYLGNSIVVDVPKALVPVVTAWFS